MIKGVKKLFILYSNRFCK